MFSINAAAIMLNNELMLFVNFLLTSIIKNQIRAGDKFLERFDRLHDTAQVQRLNLVVVDAFFPIKYDT